MKKTSEEKKLVREVERILKFGTYNAVTITAQGYCPNMCQSRLKQEPELDGEYMNFNCLECKYHARLSHVVVERAHDVPIK